MIGDPVNEAARLSDLAKREPGGVLASAATLERVGDEERALWSPGREVELRGRSGVTRVAAPASLPASAPASVPPSVPASVPPSVPASVAPSVTASVRASVPAEAAVPASAGDGVPPLTPAPGA